jgi:hypothetical protein
MPCFGPQGKRREPHQADARQRECGGMAARGAAYGCVHAREAERLDTRHCAAAGSEAAELRDGESERQRRKRRIEKHRTPRTAERRRQERTRGHPEQAPCSREPRTERKASDETSCIVPTKPTRTRERRPERRTEQRVVERIGTQASVLQRRCAVWATCSDAQNR